MKTGGDDGYFENEMNLENVIDEVVGYWKKYLDYYRYERIPSHVAKHLLDHCECGERKEELK